MLNNVFHTRPFCGVGGGLRRANRPCYRTVVAAAKKEKKGGKPQKSSALAGLIKAKEQALESKQEVAQGAAEPANPDQYANPDSLIFLLLIVDSFWKRTKRPLLDNVDFEQLAEQLYKAPFALAAHDKYDDPDFKFLYGNRRMLTLLESNWEQLLAMPSTKCTKADGLTEQEPFFGAVANSPAFAPNYEGWVVSSQGKKFRVKDGVVFDVDGPEGERLGQALYFNQYELEDGTLVTMGAEGDAVTIPLSAVPAKIKEAEAAVEKQGEFVRSLKEGQGLTNTDAQVQEAVAELKKLKEQVSFLQQRLEAESPKAA